MVEYEVNNIVKEVKVILDRNQKSDELLNINDSDTLSQDEIIKSKIETAAYDIEMKAPIYKLDGGTSLPTTEGTTKKNLLSWVVKGETRVGKLILPKDFMRLISFKMNDWETFGTVIYQQDGRYQLQNSRWGGIKGNTQKPVVAVVNHGEDRLALEIYSSNVMAPKMMIKTDGSYDIQNDIVISDNKAQITLNEELASKLKEANVYLGADGESLIIAKDKLAIDTSSYLPKPTIENGKIKLCSSLKDSILYMTAYLTCVTLGDIETAGRMLETAYSLADIPTTSATTQNS